MSNIICIGDSNVAGVWGNEGGNPTAMENPMSNVLANKLNGTAVINLGVGGDNCALIDARKSTVLQYNPSIIICEFGTNDLIHDAVFSNVQSQMASLFSYFKNTAKAKVWVLTVLPSEMETVASGYSGTFNSHQVRLDINTWLRTVPTNVDLVTDAWTLVRDPNEPMRFLYDYRGTSGYPWYGEYTNHWNQAGVNLVVSQMLSDLENQ